MTDCVEFQGSRDRKGYGQIRRQGKLWMAHRWAWVQVHGPIEGSLWVLHHCDNPACVKTDPDDEYPDGHLFLGTHADNMGDMKAKGRQASGDRNGSRLHPERVARGDQHWSRLRPERRARGSALPWAKLTESDIPIIRARLAGGEILQAIADSYGVGLVTIWDIAHGKTWRHVSTGV